MYQKALKRDRLSWARYSHSMEAAGSRRSVVMEDTSRGGQPRTKSDSFDVSPGRSRPGLLESAGLLRDVTLCLVRQGAAAGYPAGCSCWQLYVYSRLRSAPSALGRMSQRSGTFGSPRGSRALARVFGREGVMTMGTGPFVSHVSWSWRQLETPRFSLQDTLTTAGQGRGQPSRA